MKALGAPRNAENNFETLCLQSESQATHRSIISKNQSPVSQARNQQSAEAINPAPELRSLQDLQPVGAQEKSARLSEEDSRSFFLAEATNALTRQDLRTNAGGYSELSSKASPGLRIQWREDVSSSWDLDLSYSQYSINQTAPDGSSLSGDSSFAGFAIAGIWNFKQLKSADTSRWSVGPFLKYRTEPITARLNGSSIRLESPQLLLIGGSLENESVLGPKRKNLRLKTDLSAWYAPRASQSDFVISDGYGLSVDVRLLKPIRRQLDLSGGISYGLSRVKSSLGEHANQRVIFGLGLVYRFGDLEEVNGPQRPTTPTNESGGLK